MEGSQSKPRRHCPFVGNPLSECFLVGMNSQNIEQAIYYCGDNFEECEIYKKRTHKGFSNLNALKKSEVVKRVKS